MPELAPSLAAASIDYDLLLSGLMAASKQGLGDPLMTSAPPLSVDDAFGLGAGLSPSVLSPDQQSADYASMSEPSNASTPSTVAASPSDREASAPLESPPVPNMTQLFMAMFGAAQTPPPGHEHTSVLPLATDALAPLNASHMTMMRSLTASAEAPVPVPSAAPSTPQADPSHATTGASHGLDYESVCQSLKEMTASSTPATALLQFLKMSRVALGRDIPAEVVLEGLLEREKRRSTQQSASTTDDARDLSPLTSLGVSGIGPERRARVSLRAAASPYAIPPGPRVYQCDQCPLVFDRAYNLKEHLKTHDPSCNKRFPCPLGDCPHASHRRADMHRHIKNVHVKKEGLTAAQKSTVLKLYPAMRSDLYSDQGTPSAASPSPSPSPSSSPASVSAYDEDDVDWEALVKTE